MSYILEALKKSQEERELGRVPTLDANLFPTRDDATRGHPWAMVAVGLAMLAVIIALYAALRGQPDIETRPQGAMEAVAPLAPPASDLPGAEEEPGSARTEPATGSAEAIADAQPPAVAPAAAPVQRAAPESAPAPAGRRSAADAAIPPRPQSARVPEDLREDIEAFKDEVLGRERTTPPLAPPARDVPPQALTLPREVEARLPAFLMTVHVYDAEPAKRFVLINALKTREGEVSREGIRVEEILPDGAVLSYDGHRFFRAR